MWLIFFLINLINPLPISELPTVLPEAAEMALVWETLPPATCMPDHCFCEPVGSQTIRQPINTWSNLAFILVGGLTIAAAARDLWRRPGQRKRTNALQAQWSYSFLYGCAAIFIGLGSMFYHASMTFYGQVSDILSMYLLTTFMVLYNLSRLRQMRNGSFFFIYLAANIVLGFISIVWPESRRYIFVGLLTAVLITELVLHRRKLAQINTNLMRAAMGSVAVGGTAWLLDVTGTVCLPHSWLQLHALWHVAMAAAIGFLYLYYRSERREPDEPAIPPMGKLLEAEAC